MKMYYCIDCGKVKSKHGLRCLKCTAILNGLKHRGANNPMFGKHFTEEQRAKISKAGKLCTLEGRRKKRDITGVNNPMFGRHHTEESKLKMSQNGNYLRGKDHPNYGKHLDEERKKAIGNRSIGNKYSAGPRPKIEKSNNPNWRGGKEIYCKICGKSFWRRPYYLKNTKLHYCSRKCMRQDEDYIKSVVAAVNIKPNKKEQKLIDLFSSNSLPYKYVGDGQFIMGGKCPDFVNTNGQKKVIELFGNYWHKGENPQDRIDVFTPFGYSTLIIWENELKDPEAVKVKILEFDKAEVHHGIKRRNQANSS